MKKILVAILAMGLLGTGLWWTIRREPADVPHGEESAMAFRIEPSGPGTLIRYEDPQTPLRAVRWLHPLPGGLAVVQIVTQSDRQQIALFKDGQLLEELNVPKPAGVRDGFFRLAELRDAKFVENDAIVLLYAPPGASDDLPVTLALDLATKDVRWFHRAAGERLALWEGAAPVAYLFGPGTAPVRLPVALDKDEKISATGRRSAARAIELPSEIQEVGDLEPTGAWTFLLAHGDGLSAYQGSKGWLHHPMPSGNPGLFKDVRGTLAASGKRYWWQPFPGTVFQVHPDGTARQAWTSAELAAAEPFAKDSTLLHLLGTDPEGRLWFDLAAPSETPVAAQPIPEVTEETSEPPVPAPAVKLEDWSGYMAQGLDRGYCWDPEAKTLRRFAWPSIPVPQGFSRPSNGAALLPETGRLMLENGPVAWFLPLSALGLGDASTTLKPLTPGS